MEILKDIPDSSKTEISKIQIKTERIDKNKHSRYKKMVKMKRLELIGRSKVDFMIRRQRDESIKELRLFRSEEMKKIDMEIKAMKHEMMSYMIKEIEEQKQTLRLQMMEDIDNEKKKRMLIVESEYKLRNSFDKSVQTVKYPMTVNAKFDEILNELNEIKQISKQRSTLYSSQNPSENKNPCEIKSIQKTSQSSENSIDVLPKESSQEDSEKTIANSSKSLFTNIVIKEESEDNEASCTPPPEVTLVPDDDASTPFEDSEHQELYPQTLPISYESYQKKSSLEKRQYLSNKDISFSQNNFQSCNSNISFSSSQKGVLISAPLDLTSTNNFKRKIIQDNISVNSQYHLSDPSYVDSSHRMLTNSDSISSQLTPSSKATMIQTGGSRTSFIKNNPQLFSNTLHSITPKIKSYRSLTDQQQQQQQRKQEQSRFQNTMVYQTNTSSSANYNTQNIVPNWKRDYAALSSGVSYDIYAHTKEIITSQKNCKNDDERFHHRKKREINRRILEKYGPLPNVIEVCEKVQLDPMYLALNVKEKEGILSCIERSVAERANFAKDLLEDLFSREALSISSCKGSSLKTALDAERLEFIRRIVFMAMPSDEEDSMWDMIQECIDTKCRGILRNMKKKLKKSFEY